MNISAMTKEHLPALHRLEVLCFSDPWSEKALEEELENPLSCFLVAGDGIGYVGCQFVLDEGFITNLAVSPDFRRQGIAVRLLDSLCAEAKKRGVRLLHLEVREHNLPAQALYTRFGFSVDGVRRRFYTDPTEDAILMTKRLEEGDFHEDFSH